MILDYMSFQNCVYLFMRKMRMLKTSSDCCHQLAAWILIILNLQILILRKCKHLFAWNIM